MEAVTNNVRSVLSHLLATSQAEAGDDDSEAAAAKYATVNSCDVAPILREPYIHTGYRVAYKSASYYVNSLFQLHNETVNVWSHLLASMLLAYRFYLSTDDVDYLNDPKACVVLTFALNAILSSFLSAHAHLMHSQSEYHHLKYFQIDYLGVSMNFQGVGIFYLFFTGTEFFYHTYGTLWVPMLQAGTCFVCFAAMCYAKSICPPESVFRILINIIQAALLSIVVGVPLAYKTSEVVLNADWTVFYADVMPQLFHYALLAAAGFFYGCRIPEVFYPGCFDLFGHGHQIFHFLLSTLQFYQFECIVDLYQRQSPRLTALASPTLYNTMLPNVGLFMAQVAFLYTMDGCTLRAAKREHDKFLLEKKTK